MLKIYNTEQRKKMPITLPSGACQLLMYTCGPTLYNYAHIGNFRTYVFEDILRRTIQYFGFPLKQVMNFTDVDDKTIKGSLEKKLELSNYVQTYKEAFFEDLKTLNIQLVEKYAFATHYISEMIHIIQTLLKKGVAYQGKDGSVYFNISKFPSYGRLSHCIVATHREGTADDEYDKERACDFALWKSYNPQRDSNVYWESPFGRGRPGWHIECSAMAITLLGKTIDIHVGGVDNIFPHHENEIAQSEGYTGQQFVRHWIHVEHLIVNGKKMSKSLGNFYTLRDLLKKGYTGSEIRYLLLNAHYRSPLNFTIKGLESARRALLRWSVCIERLRSANGRGESMIHFIPPLRSEIRKALADDLNISAVLATLFNFLKEINTQIDTHTLSKKSAQSILQFLTEVDTILGILPLQKPLLIIPDMIQRALSKREIARKNKDWMEADRQRDYIESQGYLIEDGPNGSKVKKHFHNS